jgi:hypothetical protein
MRPGRKIDHVLKSLADWALEFPSAEHHDGDEIGSIGSWSITVGLLREAYEIYHGVPLVIETTRTAPTPVSTRAAVSILRAPALGEMDQ